MKRYFLISYSHTGPYGYGFGNGTVESPFDGYPNKEMFIKEIEAKSIYRGIVILNIVEMNKNEFELWTFVDK